MLLPQTAPWIATTADNDRLRPAKTANNGRLNSISCSTMNNTGRLLRPTRNAHHIVELLDPNRYTVACAKGFKVLSVSAEWFLAVHLIAAN